MELNRDNYETFFLDYLDGNLNNDQMNSLLDFLHQNPDLKEELLALNKIVLKPEPIGVPEKNSLYHIQDELNPLKEPSALSFTEGDMDELEKTLFLKHLEFHPEQKPEVDSIIRARLQADETIKFPKKKLLYQRKKRVSFIYWGSSIAASVVLAISLWVFFQTPKPPVQVSKQESVTQTPTNIQPERKTIATIAEEKKIQRKEPTKYAAPTVAEKKELTNTATIERKTELLASIKPVQAHISLDVQESQLALCRATPLIKPSSDYNTLSELITEKVLKPEKKQSLLEQGLNLARHFSGKRLSYKKQNGKISEVSFDSRMLAFSLPLGK